MCERERQEIERVSEIIKERMRDNKRTREREREREEREREIYNKITRERE